MLLLALLVQLVDLLHDVLSRGVSSNGQRVYQSLDALFSLGVLFAQLCQLRVVALLAAADNLFGLRQELGKGLLVGGELADLFNDLGVQRVAVAVFHGADAAVAALLGGAHISIN